eukprot:NODE_1211_length_1423_cov_107.403549_g1200_i0.p1 GENE.NODE_1211_length_1423_cov_107.403549_g1200_i0~~NODE_1211_length_1423_cov_107.403549_g1200_i0.p1  ORF type:complete len:406 (+),score=103.66 NODE_1211_length_1423_cov_107.403549_g1200_i0:172-1389(+)
MWLEQNALCKIEGLDKNTELRTLYLHENFLACIENIDHLKQLHTLNVSKNRITKLSGLEGLDELETLLATHNKFSSLASIQHIHTVPQLQCLDLSNCNIDLQEGETEEDLISFFEKMPNLSVLYLIGNPCLGKVRYYRKKMLSRLPQLKYLDDKPVFDNERRLVAAWARGGAHAENEERDLIAEEKKQEMKRDLDHWTKMQERGRPLKEQREKEWAVVMEQKQADDAERRQRRQQEQQEMIAEEERSRSTIDIEEYRAATLLMQEWARMGIQCGAKKRKQEVWGAPDYDSDEESTPEEEQADQSAVDRAVSALVAAKITEAEAAAPEPEPPTKEEPSERELWLAEMDDIETAVQAAATQKMVSSIDKEAALEIKHKGSSGVANVWSSYMQWEKKKSTQTAASAWD